MSNRVIIEIDQRQIRAVAARAVGGRSQVTRAWRILLSGSEEWADVIQRCVQELPKHHLGRAEADIIVNRRSVEMRDIKVPPAPDAELPELLKFVAKNEFAAVNEQWRLDFVPLSDNESAGRTVIAAALSPQWLSNIEQLCGRCGLKLKRILLRPFLDALIVAEHHPLGEGVNLLVHRVGETVDLTLIQNGRVLLSRSVLLAGHDESALQNETVQEIRRTIMTAPRMGQGRGVDRVLLIGQNADADRIREQFSDLPDCEFVACHPVGAPSIQLGRELEQLDHPEQFAAHLAALQSLAGSSVPQIDFANPRRRVEKSFDKRRLVLWAALLGAVILGGTLLVWQTLAGQRHTIAKMESELQAMRKANQGDQVRPGADDLIGEVRLIDRWMGGKVDLVGELHEISKRLMSADQTIVDSFTALLIKNDTLRISISGQSDSSESALNIQKSLADRPYDIVPGKIALDSNQPEYPVVYDLDLNSDLQQIDVATTINDLIVEASKGWSEPGDSAAAANGDESSNPPNPDSNR